MAELQAYSCDAITGAVVDRIPMSAFEYARMLSAGSTGRAAVPLGQGHTSTALRSLLQPLSRMIALERDGVIEFMGTIANPPSYVRGQSVVNVDLEDLWARFTRRGAWDHTAANMETWSAPVSGSLRDHAVAAIRRGRDAGPVLPAMGLPLTLPGVQGGTIARTYYGYNIEMVGDVLQDLLDEGLDLYFRPRWISNGDIDWIMEGGIGWGSGTVHELYVTAGLSDVTAFSETGDASRVTNNARVIGEGSEVDMLVRSSRDVASPYPLLDRAASMKHVSNVDQLASLAIQERTAYATPTMQWDFSVIGDSRVDVGDTVRLHFDGDPWVPDGWHTRRVVGVSATLPGPDVKQISVQPIGGA